MVPSIVRMLANKAPPSTRTHIYLAKRWWSHTVSYPHQMMRNLDMALLGRSAPGQNPKLSSRQLLLWCSFNNPGSGSPLPGLPSLLPTYTNTRTWHFVVAGGVVGQNPGALTASNAEKLRLCFYFLLVQLSVFVVGFPAMLQLDCYISELFQCSSSVQRRRRHFWQGLFTVMNTSEWSSPPPNYTLTLSHCVHLK